MSTGISVVISVPFSAKELGPEIVPIQLTAPCLGGSLKADGFGEAQPHILIAVFTAVGLFLLPVFAFRCNSPETRPCT